MSIEGPNCDAANGKQRRGPFFEFQSTSVNFWTNNRLANFFRKSGRKDGAKRKKEPPATATLAQQGKRSSSCDALNDPRLSTRFCLSPYEEQQPMGGTLLRNGTPKKKKSLDQSTMLSRGAVQSSSFSSLLHQRIFLSSRGASPLVPFKLYKSVGKASGDPQKLGSKEQKRSSKSQQNIPRIIDDPMVQSFSKNGAAQPRRRDHSLGASSGRVRQVPIIQLPSVSTSVSKPANPVAHTSFYERRQEFVQSSQQLRKTSHEEKSLALEEWMLTQPISLRRLEQHERIRLKVAGGQIIND